VKSLPFNDDKFWAKVNFTDTCWLWTGGNNGKYPIFYLGNYKTVYSHRYSWEKANQKKIPDDLTIDHLCKTPLCVRPDHLECVSLYENLMRSDGFGAENARKTHCPKGHEYTEENTYMFRGSRYCMECRNSRTSGAIKNGTFKPKSTKLTEEQVLEIRSRYIPKINTYKMLAQEYGVSASLIGHIINGRTWRNASDAK
jgi:hypothetical protein